MTKKTTTTTEKKPTKSTTKKEVAVNSTKAPKKAAPKNSPKKTEQITNVDKEQDQVTKFIFTEKAVRGQLIKIHNTLVESVSKRNYPREINLLLGEMLTINSLFIANSNFKGSINLQIQGEGAISLLLVNGDDQQQVRALARYDQDQFDQLAAQGKTSLTDLVGKGILVVNIYPEDGQRYQSLIQLKNSVIESVQDFFTQSVQVKNWIYFTQRDNESAAIQLQHMPDGIGSESDIHEIAILAATTTTTEILDLPTKELLYRLFNQEKVEVFTPQPISFKCTCSYERSLNATVHLDLEEAEKIFAEKNAIDVTCECCGEVYIVKQDEYNEARKASNS